MGFSLFSPCFIIEHKIFKTCSSASFQGLRGMCISKPPACWWEWLGSKGITSVRTQCCVDLTGDMVVWWDKKKNSGPERGRKIKRRDNRAHHRCVLVTLHVTVQWCDLGLSREQSLEWLSLMWRDMMPRRCMRGRVSGPKTPFILTLVLYRSFSHMFWHSVSNSLPSSSLCQSYRPCHAATHFPSLFNSFLSIPLALIFLLTLPRQVSCESVTQYRAAGMGAASNTSPMDR